MKSKGLLLVLMCSIILSSLSCKKKIEEQYEDVIKKLMVDGSWTVTKFTENGNDITTSFNGWICKFNDDNTMSATQGAGATAVVHAGVWQTNLSAQTISAQFNGAVGDPLAKINGTWNITSSAPTVGKFAQTKAGISYTMELTKY